MAVFRLQRQASSLPIQDSARHIVGIETGLAQCSGGHRRARPAAAVEDDGTLPGDRVHLGRELRELYQPPLGDPAGLVFVGLADVNQLHLPGGQELGHLLRGVVAWIHRISVMVQALSVPRR